MSDLAIVVDGARYYCVTQLLQDIHSVIVRWHIWMWGPILLALLIETHRGRTK